MADLGSVDAPGRMPKNGGPLASALMPSKQSLTPFAAALALTLVLTLVGGASHAQKRVRIVLLPMVVHSAESPGYVRSGLADMLGARLERIPDFEVIRVDESGAATTNLDRALQRARSEDAEFVLFGSFTRFGTGASLDVHCAATHATEGGAPLRQIFVHSGEIGNVIPDLDDLVGKVARFVVRDYTEQVAAAGDDLDLPSTRAIGSLEARVAKLEEVLRSLTERLAAEPSAEPADVAGGPE
jgi:TolB-like protein